MPNYGPIVPEYYMDENLGPYYAGDKKYCVNCGELKPVDCFRKQAPTHFYYISFAWCRVWHIYGDGDGLTKVCRKCQNEYKRKRKRNA